MAAQSNHLQRSLGAYFNTNARFFQLGSKDMILVLSESFIGEFYCHCQSTESYDTKPKGNVGSLAQTPSQFLYRRDHAEINRFITAIFSLKWLITNDYESFTSGQTGSTKLTKASFRELRELLVKFSLSSGQINVLCVVLLIRNLGAVSEFRCDVLSAYTNNDSEKQFSDHEVIERAAKEGYVAAVKHLPEDLKKWLLEGLKPRFRVDIEQLAQAENAQAEKAHAENADATHLQLQTVAPWALEFIFVEMILAIASSQGHVDTRGAIAFTEPICRL